MAEKFEDPRTDEALMRAYQDGDSAAFEVLYSRHSSKVYGFLVSQLKSRAKAEDVFQAVFLKLHTSRHHYDPTFPFMPWLFTVTKSAMLDAVKKEKTVREIPDEDSVRKAVAPPPAPQGVDLEGLRGEQKTAIELRYEADMSFEEIARKLDTSPANVRQLISRGLKKLRTLGSDGGTK